MGLVFWCLGWEIPAVPTHWLKTLKITLSLAKWLFTFWTTHSGDSIHRQDLNHRRKWMCTKHAPPEGKAFLQPPEAAAFSKGLSFLTPITGVGGRAEKGREAGWQLGSCHFSTGFLRKPGVCARARVCVCVCLCVWRKPGWMSSLGTDKTERQLLSWALVSCKGTWTTHPPHSGTSAGLTHFLYPEEKQGLLGQSLDLHSQRSRSFSRFREVLGTNPQNCSQIKFFSY